MNDELIKDEEEEDEKGKNKQKRARLRNLRVNFVSLVDDPAVQDSYYRFIKMEKDEKDLQQEMPGISNEELVDANESSDDESVDGNTLTENAFDVMETRISELSSLVEDLSEKISDQSENYVRVSEAIAEMEEKWLSTNESSKEDEQTAQEESSAVSVEAISEDESSTEEPEPQITPDMLESLSELTTQMNEMYNADEISDEEFDNFNNEVQQILGEVA